MKFSVFCMSDFTSYIQIILFSAWSTPLTINFFELAPSLVSIDAQSCASLNVMYSLFLEFKTRDLWWPWRDIANRPNREYWRRNWRRNSRRRQFRREIRNEIGDIVNFVANFVVNYSQRNSRHRQFRRQFRREFFFPCLSGPRTRYTRRSGYTVHVYGFLFVVLDWRSS